MKIQLEFFGDFKKYASDSFIEIELPAGAKVSDIFKKYKFKKEDSEMSMAFVNEKPCAKSKKLNAGDKVKIFQAVGGG